MFLLKITDGLLWGGGITGLLHVNWSYHLSPISSWITIPIIQPSKFVSTEGKQLEFWGCFEDRNSFYQGTQRLIGWISDKIIGKNIAKFWRGGIYKPSIQAEILKNSQEVEFINQDYRQKYCKTPKRDRALTHHGPTPPLTPTKNYSLKKNQGQNNRGIHRARIWSRKDTCYGSQRTGGGRGLGTPT